MQNVGRFSIQFCLLHNYMLGKNLISNDKMEKLYISSDSKWLKLFQSQMSKRLQVNMLNPEAVYYCDIELSCYLEAVEGRLWWVNDEVAESKAESL